MAQLRAHDISKTFAPGRPGETVAVFNASFAVNDGELLVVIGPSGSGKTTLLRLIAGLETPDEGTIHLGKSPIHQLPPEARHVTMVFQRTVLLPHLTVEENIALALQLRKTPKPDRPSRVNEVATVTGIQALLKRRPPELSGGEQQRVAFARALAVQPEIFLFDEPLASLDPVSRIDLRQSIRELRRFGKPMIYVTHDQEEALAIADRLLVFTQGKIEQIGTGSEVYQHPANVNVARFIGRPRINLAEFSVEASENEPFLVATKESRIRFPMLGAWPPIIGARQTVTLGIRPEDLHLSNTKSDSESLQLKVECVEFGGHESIVHLSDDVLRWVSRLPARQTPPSSGATIWARFDLDRAILFDSVTGENLSLSRSAGL